MTTQADEFLIDYLTRQDAARTDRAATAFAALTDRERLLVKEAAVMGYVRGTMAPKGEKIPKDSAITQEVVTACLSFPDLYPTITGYVADDEPEDGEAS
jgi:hypothetical protein